FSQTAVLRGLPRLGVNTLTANELRVSQTLAYNTAKRLNESASITFFALVKSERLFIAVSKQMKRLNINISPFERPLQKRPEVLKSVSVDLASCVAFQVVNDLAVIILFKIIIGHKRIGAYGRACFDLLADIAAKLRTARCLNDFQNHTREFIALTTFKNALYGRLGDSRISNASSAILVHVASLSTDIGFVRFARSAHF